MLHLIYLRGKTWGNLRYCWETFTFVHHIFASFPFAPFHQNNVAPMFTQLLNRIALFFFFKILPHPFCMMCLTIICITYVFAHRNIFIGSKLLIIPYWDPRYEIFDWFIQLYNLVIIFKCACFLQDLKRSIDWI